MSEELYFNNELRNCLDAAVYSDCGENDQWNYWYQRLRKAHDAAVDRVTETQRAENAKLRRDLEEANSQAEEVCIENAKLRKLVRDVVLLAGVNGCDVTKMRLYAHGGDWRTVWERMRELDVPGTEVDHD